MMQWGLNWFRFRNQDMGPSGFDICHCSNLSSLCWVPSARDLPLLPPLLLWGWHCPIVAVVGPGHLSPVRRQACSGLKKEPHLVGKEPGHFCSIHQTHLWLQSLKNVLYHLAFLDQILWFFCVTYFWNFGFRIYWNYSMEAQQLSLIY